MATAGDIAQAGLKRILAQASEAPLEADDYADFLSGMNRYMAALKANGIHLGYTNVTQTTDTVTVPEGAELGVMANVAILVAADYGGVVSSSLAQEAKIGLRAMRRLGKRPVKTSFPTSLPLGSGTENSPDLYSHYYAQAGSALIALAGNTDATAFTASDTAARVAGEWQIVRSRGFQADINGRLTNVSAKDIDVDVDIALNATGSGTYTFRLMENGVSRKTATSALTATPAEVTLRYTLTVEPQNYLELWVEDDGGTTSATIADCQFELK